MPIDYEAAESAFERALALMQTAAIIHPDFYERIIKESVDNIFAAGLSDRVLYEVGPDGPYDLEVDNGVVIENITDDLVNGGILVCVYPKTSE